MENNRGGARPNSGPKKKEGSVFIMVPVSREILNVKDQDLKDLKKRVVNFAEKAIYKEFKK